MAYLFNKTQDEYDDLFHRICRYLRGMKMLEGFKDDINKADKALSLRGDVVALFTANEDSYIRSSLMEVIESIGSSIESLESSLQSDFETEFCPKWLGEFLEKLEEEVEEPVEAQDGNGNVTITYPGLLGMLREHMSNNLTELNEAGNQMSNWHLEGRNINAGTVGILYVTLTKPVADTLVKVYKTAGPADLVASGQITAGVGPEVVVLTEENTSGLSGEVLVTYAGDDLDIQLVPQTVDANITAFDVEGSEISNFFPEPDNIGKALFQNYVAGELVKPGKLLLECTNQTIGRETLKVTNEFGEEAARNARVHAIFKSADLFVEFDVDRVYTTSPPDVAGTLSAWTINGENSSNCSSGMFWGTMTIEGLNTTIDLFSDSARANKVATKTVLTATLPGIISFDSVNYSGITGTVDATANAEGDFTVDLNVLKLEDKWWVEITNDELGLIQTAMRRFKVPLPSDNAGNETLDDGWMAGHPWA